MLSLVLAAALAAAPLPPEEDRQLARAILEELVTIKTTHDVGTTVAARAIEQHLLKAGFATEDATFVAPAEHPNKGNVVVRYRGHAKGQPVLFLGHLDVVEAKAEDWSVDPFKLTEKDGWLYGRGTIDMKDGDAAMLEALIRLKREHFKPQRDVIVAFTADEEAGGDANGPAFLLKEHRDLVNAGLVINLDGGGGVYKNGEREFFELGTSEKNYVTYTLEATGPGGHGSLPGPGQENPIYRLGAALGRLEAYRFPVMLTDTTRAYFAKVAGVDLDKDPTAVDRLSDNVGFNARLRTTCVATLIAGGHAENALPQRARATIQCRMMPGDSEQHVQAQIVATVNDPKITVTLNEQPIISPESPPTAALTRKVEKVAHSMWPKVPVVPTMATGFSDDRQTRNAGMPSYDLGGVWIDADENRAHGRDERVGAREFDESVEYTYRLIKAFSRAD
jgi:acetylornithine deacetylase/succinyl-diaminopimelate desuccinylase-like protein